MPLINNNIQAASSLLSEQQTQTTGILELQTRIGAVSTTPTINTLQDRLKSIFDLLTVSTTPSPTTIQGRIQQIIDSLANTATPISNSVQERLQKLVISLGSPSDIVAAGVAETYSLISYLKLYVLQFSSLNTYTEITQHNTSSLRPYKNSFLKKIDVGTTNTILITDLEVRYLWTLYHNGTADILLRMKDPATLTDFDYPVKPGELIRENFGGTVNAISTSGTQQVMVALRGIFYSPGT